MHLTTDATFFILSFFSTFTLVVKEEHKTRTEFKIVIIITVTRITIQEKDGFLQDRMVVDEVESS